MCSRYFLDADDISDAELIALLDRERASSEEAGKKPTGLGEMKPGQSALVIALNRRMVRSAFRMQWGYHDKNRLIFNARSESAADKIMFRQSTMERRCLIPASAYYEWDHRVKPFTKYRFYLEDQRMLYLAGLYRFEPDRAQPVFTILTRQAVPEVHDIHDRMPVLIPPNATDAWLDHGTDFNQLLNCAQKQMAWCAEI